MHLTSSLIFMCSLHCQPVLHFLTLHLPTTGGWSCGYTTRDMVSLDSDLSGKQKLFHFMVSPTHGQPLRISPTWFHSGLLRRTPVAFHVSHCALGIWLWSSKTSRSSRTVYQRALGAFCADLFVTDGCLLAFSGSLTRLRESHDAQL